MTFDIRYEGDEHELLVTFLEALHARAGADNWLVQLELRDDSTLEGRLHHVDADRVVLLAVDPEADYEPYPDRRTLTVDTDDVYRVVVP